MFHHMFSPALLACISEGRKPDTSEIEDVTAQILQEAFGNDPARLERDISARLAEAALCGRRGIYK